MRLGRVGLGQEVGVGSMCIRFKRSRLNNIVR